MLYCTFQLQYPPIIFYKLQDFLFNIQIPYLNYNVKLIYNDWKIVAYFWLFKVVKRCYKDLLYAHDMFSFFRLTDWRWESVEVYHVQNQHALVFSFFQTESHIFRLKNVIFYQIPYPYKALKGQNQIPYIFQVFPNDNHSLIISTLNIQIHWILSTSNRIPTRGQ